MAVAGRGEVPGCRPSSARSSLVRMGVQGTGVAAASHGRIVESLSASKLSEAVAGSSSRHRSGMGEDHNLLLRSSGTGKGSDLPWRRFQVVR